MTDMAASLLLVEDSDTQALLIRRRLEGQGFAVHRVASAEEALERLNQALPDLLVADFHLPGMSGGELVRRLRLDNETRAIPVLMLTEASEPDMERQGIESGADAYVPKSAAQDILALRIRALLRNGGSDHASDAAGGRPRPGTVRFRQARLLVLARKASEALRASLGRDGYQLTAASDPAEARTLLEQDPDQDCLVVDLADGAFDGLGFCEWADARRGRDIDPAGMADPAAGDAAGVRGFRWRILGVGPLDPAAGLAARAFEAGVDDLVPFDPNGDGLALRLKAVMRRKLIEEERQRLDAELGERERSVERARAEAAANAAQASLAGALARANQELEAANNRLREAQGKLVQSAKMASLGELVAGIAHEINNPLAFILAHQGTVERLLGRIASGELPEEERQRSLSRAHDRVASMSLGLKRIQDLVLNLRRFSRLDESEQQLVDVPDSIDTILALLTHKLGPGITVERRYRAPRELFCQPALLNQVIMNIVGNAADALNAAAAPAGDSAVPSPDDAPSSGPGGLIRIDTLLENDAYRIAVSDNGPGVPAALRERVFEPFFTTKPVGAGTGLGLAIAYSVVEAHGGAVSVEDAPGGGACFTVSIPVPATSPDIRAGTRTSEGTTSGSPGSGPEVPEPPAFPAATP
ncbi:response regulator [Rhizosaccharibacter radicis]|uniref:histidine kinase n=1 Tax=Rhizosaccharibacter radicis TaxID=2782605 RepID=A0ABT1VXL9_9PROT|nr:response regulator [Acetobacteraceae bacterium KSS12]